MTVHNEVVQVYQSNCIRSLMHLCYFDHFDETTLIHFIDASLLHGQEGKGNISMMILIARSGFNPCHVVVSLDKTLHND